MEDLGLTTTSASGVIAGTHLLAGLSSTLLKDLKGGAGVSGLGHLNVTDRNGITANVDLSQAQSVDDVITAINAGGNGVKASVNAARNGIQLTDTTGATGSNLVVATADASQSAEQLGLVVNSAANSFNSGDLGRKTVNENTLLASLIGGSGVGAGNFTITDSNGRSARVTVDSQVLTIGDLIQAIDNTGLQVQAAVNSTGDGIVITDTAHASGALQVQEGNSTTAASLHILGAATTATVAGQPTQSIDGSTTYHLALSSTDTLQSLVQKINNLNSGATAAESNSGSLVNPFRLTLTSKSTGAASQLLFDTSQTSFHLQEIAKGQDALLLTGAAGAGGFVASSATNRFNSVLPGAALTAVATTAAPVTLSIAGSTSGLSTAIKTLVDTYNTLHATIAADTSFNSTTNTGALLQGDGAVLQVDSNLSRLLSSQLFGNGAVDSLSALGVSYNQDGTLSVNDAQLQNAVANNPSAVRQFFATSGTGLSDKLSGVIDQLSGPGHSLLVDRLTALNSTITSNQTRITTLAARLTADQTRLTAEFNNMEVVVSRLQSNLSALSSIQGFSTIGGQLGSSNSLTSGSSSSSSRSVGSSF